MDPEECQAICDIADVLDGILDVLCSARLLTTGEASLDKRRLEAAKDMCERLKRRTFEPVSVAKIRRTK